MFTVLVFAVGLVINITVARSTSGLPNGPSNAANEKSVIPHTDNKIVPGSSLYMASSDNTPLLEPAATFLSETSNANAKLRANSENHVRDKRFLNNVIGSALGSLRGGTGNWQECGRTHRGATIYTNGIGIACFGSCPEHVRCGYGRDNGYFGADRIGYQGRVDFGRISLG